MAGNVWTMEPGAIIGVHSWYDDDDKKGATEYPRHAYEHKMFREYTKRMRGSEDFYWFTIRAAPAEGMHTMTVEEIARYGILTQ